LFSNQLLNRLPTDLQTNGKFIERPCCTLVTFNELTPIPGSGFDSLANVAEIIFTASAEYHELNLKIS
jgi:hypothetical protein